MESKRTFKETSVSEEVFEYIMTVGNRPKDYKEALIADTKEKFPEWAVMISGRD